MDIKVFKIFNPKTGLYSKGGMGNSNNTKYFWGKKGKTWNDLGHVKLHLNLQYYEKFNYDINKYQITGYSPLLKQYINDNCVVVEYSNQGTTTYPIMQFIKLVSV